MKARILRSSFAGIAVAAALALAACGGGGDDDSNDGNGGNGGNGNGADNGPSVPADATEFVIVMKDNVFEPAEFSIAKGQTVTFVAKNEGTAIHNMSILETNMKSDAIVQPGTESSFEVRFDEAGEFDFQCDYHLPDMVGEITVK